MKKYLISAILSTNVAFASGIPTVDVAAIVQALTQNIKEVQEWATQAQRWSETTTQYKNELTAYQDELMSKTGVRDSVQFLKDLQQLKKYADAYGEDYLDLANNISNPNSRVGNAAKALFEKYNIYDRCKNDFFQDWEKKNCENTLARETVQIATVQESEKLLNKTITELDDLGKKAANTKDIKESQDMANAINLQLSNLQVVSMKMDMMAKQNEAQARAEEEQRRRKQAMLWGKGQGDFSNAK